MSVRGQPLDGSVEVDETFLGGPKPGKRGPPVRKLGAAGKGVARRRRRNPARGRLSWNGGPPKSEGLRGARPARPPRPVPRGSPEPPATVSRSYGCGLAACVWP